MFLLLQFKLWSISRVSPVESLEKFFVETKCLQHKFFVDDRQAAEPVYRPLLLGFFRILRPWLTCV